MRLSFIVAFCLSAWVRPAYTQSAPYGATNTRLIQSLAGTVLSEDDGLARPSRVIAMNGRLVVLDRGADQAIRLYATATGQRIATFGRRGQGPGEFTGAWDLFRGSSSHVIWVLDVSQRRVTQLSIDSLLSSARYRGDAQVLLSGEGSLESLRLLGNRGFIGTGSFASGRLALYSPTGTFLQTTGLIPRGGARWAPVVAQDAFAARLEVHDAEDRVVVAYRWTDRIDVLDSKGTLLATMDRPLGFEPIISGQSTSRAAFTLDSRRAYLSAVSANHHVYALFSGRTEREAGKANVFGRDVLVFASSGKLRRILRLDADVLAIAIDDKARELYALSHDPVPRIIRYRLPVIEQGD